MASRVRSRARPASLPAHCRSRPTSIRACETAAQLGIESNGRCETRRAGPSRRITMLSCCLYLPALCAIPSRIAPASSGQLTHISAARQLYLKAGDQLCMLNELANFLIRRSGLVFSRLWIRLPPLISSGIMCLHAEKDFSNQGLGSRKSLRSHEGQPENEEAGRQQRSTRLVLNLNTQSCGERVLSVRSRFISSHRHLPRWGKKATAPSATLLPDPITAAATAQLVPC